MRSLSNMFLCMFCKEAAFHYRNRLNKNLYLTNIQGPAGMTDAMILVKPVYLHS